MTSPLLLETIRLENGQLPYLHYHQQRLDQSRAVHYENAPTIDLQRIIEVPESYREGLFKVRVLYGEAVQSIEFHPYTIRPLTSLQLTPILDLSYAHKYADRRALHRIFEARSWGDDVLLVRDGWLTDTSYANVALFDGSSWYTPARPLLPGTARTRYLEAGLIETADIHVRDVSHFRELKLINAMLEWEESPRIAVEKIKA